MEDQTSQNIIKNIQIEYQKFNANQKLKLATAACQVKCGNTNISCQTACIKNVMKKN